jgi:hypothetical protein
MKRRLLSFAAALAVVAAIAAVLASGASADQPVRFPLSPPGSFTLSGACSFDVQVTLIASNEVETDFSNGASIITGRLVDQFTNATTGKSLVVNISGPAFFSPTGQLVVTGTNEIGNFSFPSGVFITHGPVMFDFANNTFTTTSAAMLDLCAALS